MMQLTTPKVAILAVALGFAGTAALAQSTPDAATQRAAIFACKDAAGVGGQTKLTTQMSSSSLFGPTTTLVVIQPHDQVTPALADQINACAQNSLGTGAVAAAAPARSSGTVSSPQGAVDQCIFETRAAGSFSVSNSGDVPVVSPSDGASASGAQKVNDCILDKYRVQFGTASGAAVAAGNTESWWNAVIRTSCPGGVMWGGNGYCFKR